MWSFYLICKRTTNIIRLADLRTDDAQSASPDSEQIEPAGAGPLRRNSVSVEQIQDGVPYKKREPAGSLFLYVDSLSDRTKGSSLEGRTPFKMIKYRFERKSRVESFARTRRFLIFKDLLRSSFFCTFIVF